MHKHNWENFSITRYLCISEISPRRCLCWCRERALSCLWENEKRNFSRFFLLFPLSLRSSTANACMIYDSLSCHIDFRMVLEIIYHQSEKLSFYRLQSSRTFLSTASHVLIPPSFIAIFLHKHKRTPKIRWSTSFPPSR